MKRVIGKCGHCGGRVTVPTVWHSVNPPIPECDSCHAQVDDTAHLPTLPMRPRAQSYLSFGHRESRTDDQFRAWMRRIPSGRIVLR